MTGEKVRIENDKWIVESDDARIDITSDAGYCMEFKIVAYKGTVTHKETIVAASNTPELYTENLTTLKQVMEQLDHLVSIDGVFDIEIRVRVDDVDSWAVIGYGESGDPCILRFESP